MNRAARAALWCLPPVFLLALYWNGLRAWFQQDDFAWLGLARDVHSARDLIWALFAPMAQGTIRPWSERVFFMLFSELFGLDPLPFRIWVFLTQTANLALLASIGLKLTGSRTVGLLAAVFWVASTALSRPMTWTSAYNQVLCGFFVLSAFWFFLRHTETGRRRDYVVQWALFLLGFGALEVNVVYPALAAAYALACARPYFLRTLPMFAPSLVYAAAHQWATCGLATGPYARHFDASMLGTLWEYWRLALGPVRLDHFWRDPTAGIVGTWLLSAGLLGFVAWQSWKRRWLAAFLLAWFLILIAPVLPLRDHVTDYYLTLPAAGLAMLLALGVSHTWDRRGWRAPALSLAVLYLACSLPVTRKITRIYFEQSRKVRSLVLSVVRAAELHPREAILLTGIDTTMFWSAIVDRPFRLFDVRNVYLAPGSESDIQAYPGLGEISDFVLPAAATRKALANYQAVVYHWDGSRLRNVTSAYLAMSESRRDGKDPQQVDVGQRQFAPQLGPTWYAPEDGFRWMPRRATVRLAGPQRAGARLLLSGFAPQELLEAGPVRISVQVNGQALPGATVSRGGAPFELEMPLPDSLVGAQSIEAAIEVDRTFRLPPDVRELSLRFGVVAVK